MERTQLIFDWIFHAPMSENNVGQSYELHYLPAADVGLTENAIRARKEKESKSASTVKNILSKKYDTIEKVFEFLTTEHSFYTASKLVERGMDDGSRTDNVVGMLVQDSYGGLSKKQRTIGWRNKSAASLSFLNGIAFGMGLMAVVIMFSRKKGGSGKRHLK